MSRKLQYYRLVWLKYDFTASLAVFFVALPLCLGIALASGAPLYSGLLSGIIGGIVVASLSGAQLAVSGPAAGLTTLVAAALLSLGDYKLFLLSVIIAGFIQLIFGVLKFGSVSSFFPSSVIKGMLAAIGIILISKQVPIALGYDQPDFWTSGFLDLFSSRDIKGNVIEFSQHVREGAILIAAISLLFMVLIQKAIIKKVKLIPAPLVVVLMGIGLSFLLKDNFPSIALTKSQMVSIPDNIFADISFPDFTQIFSNILIWKYGVILAILASLETLLSIEAIDKLDRQNRITPVNKELVAQGVGNMLCGLLGAIPLTAVVVRGSANIDAGGRTKLSAITHGFLLLLAVLVIPFVLNEIPYASLAAILLVTGYNLTRPKLYLNMWKLGLKQFLPFILTIVFILLTDLLIGVSIGLLLSVYFIVQNNFKAEYKVHKEKYNGIETYSIILNSNVTFLNKYKLKKALDEVPEYSVLVVDGSNCNFIDHDILEIISEYKVKAKNKHIDLQLKKIECVNVTSFH